MSVPSEDTINAAAQITQTAIQSTSGFTILDAKSAESAAQFFETMVRKIQTLADRDLDQQ